MRRADSWVPGSNPGTTARYCFNNTIVMRVLDTRIHESFRQFLDWRNWVAVHQFGARFLPPLSTSSAVAISASAVST